METQISKEMVLLGEENSFTTRRRCQSCGRKLPQQEVWSAMPSCQYCAGKHFDNSFSHSVFNANGQLLAMQIGRCNLKGNLFKGGVCSACKVGQETMTEFLRVTANRKHFKDALQGWENQLGVTQ